MSDRSMKFEVLDAQTIKLEMPHWPDENDEFDVARLIIKADKITGGAK